MLTLTQFITERFRSTPGDAAVIQKHADALHHILHTSYKGVEGGYGGHGSGTQAEHDAIHADLNNPNHHVKIHTKDGKPTAVVVSKQQHGRKIIAVGTDGSEHGKKALHDIMKSGHKHKTNMWGEFSGALGHIAKKHGWPTIHNQHAHELVGKKIIRHSPDGTTYHRLIGGELHEKSVMGNPEKSVDKLPATS